MRIRLPLAASCPSCRSRLSADAVPRSMQRSLHGSLRSSSSDSRSSQQPSYYPSPAQLTTPTYARLTNRSLIRLHGKDVIHFLNGLLPCKIQPLPNAQARPIFTAFLSAKGRILYDVFVYPPLESDLDGSWYIDVDSQSAMALHSHLKKHKLRSKFKLERVDKEELAIYYHWPTDNKDLPQPQIGGQDPRPLMGTRFLSPSGSNLSSTLNTLQQTGTEGSLADYHIHRILTGHAEGPSELISNSALPQESNIDFTGGIDFHKGCYLGQELTIRTHHTGVVRKRILPCQIYTDEHTEPTPDQQVPTYDPSISPPQPPSETNISKIRPSSVGSGSGTKSGRSTGKWLGGVGNIGLALCRLEMMTDINLTAEGTGYTPTDQFQIVWEDIQPEHDGRSTIRQVKLKPLVPGWLRHALETSIKARSERGQKKRRQETDEDEED